jgi:DNA-binding CsgD family transcriptional regulator
MTGLYELIACYDVSYNEAVPSEGRIEWTAFPEQGQRMAEFVPVFERLMRQNPLIKHFEDTGDTRAMMWSDFLTLEQFERTSLFKEMFGPLGVVSQMAVTLPTPPGIVVGFAVNTDDRDFDERDRAILNTLRPHLAHAYRSIQLHDELSATRSALRERGWTGALANADGIVEAVTDNAVALESETGIEMHEGEPLPSELRERFRTEIAAYRPSEPAVISRPTRLSDEADGVAGWHVPGPVAPHVVMIQTGVDAAARRLNDAGLTKRQTEVALRLAEGGTNAVIARRLGIAEGTLRKHLERIYRALDVTDRATAIARIRGW